MRINRRKNSMVVDVRCISRIEDLKMEMKKRSGKKQIWGSGRLTRGTLLLIFFSCDSNGGRVILHVLRKRTSLMKGRTETSLCRLKEGEEKQKDWLGGGTATNREGGEGVRGYENWINCWGNGDTSTFTRLEVRVGHIFGKGLLVHINIMFMEVVVVVVETMTSLPLLLGSTCIFISRSWKINPRTPLQRSGGGGSFSLQVIKFRHWVVIYSTLLNDGEYDWPTICDIWFRAGSNTRWFGADDLALTQTTSLPSVCCVSSCLPSVSRSFYTDTAPTITTIATGAKAFRYRLFHVLPTTKDLVGTSIEPRKEESHQKRLICRTNGSITVRTWKQSKQKLHNCERGEEEEGTCEGRRLSQNYLSKSKPIVTTVLMNDRRASKD
ncbi:unnamed protein product [Lactuca virosa]|uniref:Uncharacterized protein n=1 Tax=Lactuca virosa TaxID=75947 RepID=A0AAU9MEC4_9ASTR|nr:unnamed protein product [Lactuca virosa]